MRKRALSIQVGFAGDARPLKAKLPLRVRLAACVVAGTRVWQAQSEQSRAEQDQPAEGRSEQSRADVSQATAGDARDYSVWTRLEREFALGEGLAAGSGLLLPRHSRGRFIEFAGWLAADAERAIHLEAVQRAAGVFVRETRLADFTLASMMG